MFKAGDKCRQIKRCSGVEKGTIGVLYEAEKELWLDDGHGNRCSCNDSYHRELVEEERLEEQPKAAKVNYILQYKNQVGVVLTECFEEISEVETKVKDLYAETNNINKESFVVHHVAASYSIKASTKLTKKLIK